MALKKPPWLILVNNLGYDNNFQYREWNDEFRKNNVPPPITPPKKNIHLQIINLLKESLLPEIILLQEIHLIRLHRHITPLLIHT